MDGVYGSGSRHGQSSSSTTPLIQGARQRGSAGNPSSSNEAALSRGGESNDRKISFFSKIKGQFSPKPEKLLAEVDHRRINAGMSGPTQTGYISKVRKSDAVDQFAERHELTQKTLLLDLRKICSPVDLAQYQLKAFQRPTHSLDVSRAELSGRTPQYESIHQRLMQWMAQTNIPKTDPRYEFIAERKYRRDGISKKDFLKLEKAISYLPNAPSALQVNFVQSFVMAAPGFMGQCGGDSPRVVKDTLFKFEWGLLGDAHSEEEASPEEVLIKRLSAYMLEQAMRQFNDFFDTLGYDNENRGTYRRLRDEYLSKGKVKHNHQQLSFDLVSCFSTLSRTLQKRNTPEIRELVNLIKTVTEDSPDLISGSKHDLGEFLAVNFLDVYIPTDYLLLNLLSQCGVIQPVGQKVKQNNTEPKLSFSALSSLMSMLEHTQDEELRALKALVMEHLVDEIEMQSPNLGNFFWRSTEDRDQTYFNAMIAELPSGDKFDLSFVLAQRNHSAAQHFLNSPAVIPALVSLTDLTPVGSWLELQPKQQLIDELYIKALSERNISLSNYLKGSSAARIDLRKAANAVDGNGYHLLESCVRNSDVEGAKFFIAMGLSLSVRSSGHSLLSLALQVGHEPMLDYLLSLDVDWPLSNGSTVLHDALKADSEEAVLKLIEKLSPRLIRQPDWHGNTALHEAVRTGKMRCIEPLVKKGCPPAQQNNDKETPLHILARRTEATRDRLEDVLQLMTEGMIFDHKDRNGDTTVILAAKNNRHSIIKALLLVEGIDLNTCDSSGKSAIQWAAERGHAAVVADLMGANGIKYQMHSSDQTGLMDLAIKKDQGEVLTILMNSPNFDLTSLIRINGKDQPALLSAIEAGTYSVAKALANCVNLAHNDDKSMVHRALKLVIDRINTTKLNDTQSVEALENLGMALLDNVTADVIDQKDFSQNTLLHYLANVGMSQLLKKALGLSSKSVNAANLMGNTPLHRAVRKGHIDSIKVLLQVPSITESLSVKDCEGYTPEMLVQNLKSQDQLEELFKAAKTN